MHNFEIVIFKLQYIFLRKSLMSYLQNFANKMKPFLAKRSCETRFLVKIYFYFLRNIKFFHKSCAVKFLIAVRECRSE